MLVISAVCVMGIAPGEVRAIKDRAVFATTAAFSLFAYGWLVFILVYSSPNIVTIGEGVATLAFMPLLVGVAYTVDQRYHLGECIRSCCCFKCCCGGKKTGQGQELVGFTSAGKPITKDEIWKAYTKLKAANPELAAGGEMDAMVLSMFQPPKSAAYYRVNSVRDALGKGSDGSRRKSMVADQRRRSSMIAGCNSSFERAIMQFEHASVTVKEAHAFVELSVTRSGNLEVPAKATFRTRGSASVDGMAVEETEGLVSFGAWQPSSFVRIDLLAGDKRQAASGKAAFTVELTASSDIVAIGLVPDCIVYIGESATAGKVRRCTQPMWMLDVAETPHAPRGGRRRGP